MGVDHLSDRLAPTFVLCGPLGTISGQDKITVIQICLNGKCIIRQMFMWSSTDDEPYCGVMSTD